MDWEAFYNEFRRADFIPGYEILHRLGGGAFGEVYKARKHSIGKSYAIKFLRMDEGAPRDVVERELDQVRLFAAIDHPNLVTIEDMGIVRGVPYLIMGYAGEDTLARRMKRGELDRDSALSFFVQSCRGVLALHDRRLAHFDLKPSNIFLRGDVARVGDYGLAKLLTDGRQTLSFGRGTPHYMAPEMLRNRADHRADIYSLGVILFETMAGRLPFASDTTLGVPVREDDLPPEFPADFPAALRPAVERCLRMQPDERFANVNELLEALGQTSRQGDSIALPWAAPGAASSVRPAPEPDSDARPASDTRPKSSGDVVFAESLQEADPTSTPVPEASPTQGELKTAAKELARGAVGVARGAWGGVVTASQAFTKRRDEGSSRVSAAASDGPPDASANGRNRTDTGETGSTVLTWKTLDEPDEPDAAAREARDPGRPASVALRAAAAQRARQRIPPPTGSACVAVPVPPRVEGGLVGGAVAIAALGIEMIATLVAGPLLSAVQALGRPRRGASPVPAPSDRPTDAAPEPQPTSRGGRRFLRVILLGTLFLGGLGLVALLVGAIFALLQ